MPIARISGEKCGLGNPGERMVRWLVFELMHAQLELRPFVGQARAEEVAVVRPLAAAQGKGAGTIDGDPAVRAPERGLSGLVQMAMQNQLGALSFEQVHQCCGAS